MDIRVLSGEELDAFDGARVYEIIDAELIEGVYYLIVDQENNRVSVTSLNTDGDINQTDLFTLMSRIDQLPEQYDENDDEVQQEADTDTLSWQGDIDLFLSGLLGVHAAVVQKDLATEFDTSAGGEEFQAQMLNPPDFGSANRDNPSHGRLGHDDVHGVVGTTQMDFDPSLDFGADISEPDDLTTGVPDVPASIDPNAGDVDPSELTPPDGGEDDSDQSDGSGEDDADAEVPSTGVRKVKVKS